MDIEFTFPEKEVLKKIARFCSYRDRSIGEVKLKLRSLGVTSGENQKFIDYLTQEKYLDEERFSRVYVRSKLLHNHWGRQKIYAGLKSKFVDIQHIEKALETIDMDEYNVILKGVLQKKTIELKSLEPIARKQKLIRYALSKGFTYEEIMKQLKTKL